MSADLGDLIASKIEYYFFSRLQPIVCRIQDDDRFLEQHRLRHRDDCYQSLHLQTLVVERHLLPKFHINERAFY